METTTNLLEETKIYVGTYKKYNEGSIFGEWLNLSDYNDLEEFYNACKELHKDEHDPEFMFQDYETPDLLKEYISESHIDENIFQIAECLNVLENYSSAEWMQLHNECNEHDQIFDFDEGFFNTFFSSPYEAARAVQFGDINWNHQYIKFDGYGNLDSYEDPRDCIDEKELTKYYLDNNL